MQKISNQTLDMLRKSGPAILHQAVFQAAIELELTDRPLSDSNPETRELFAIVWEQTLSYLDANHPGWRGREVVFLNGQVC